MSEIVFSEDQEKAYNTIARWMAEGGIVHDSQKDPLLLSMGGFAGTGKTTLVSALAKDFGKAIRFAFCALSGRAASILGRKLIDHGVNVRENKSDDGHYCGTIHGLIYQPVENDDGEVISWIRRDALPYDVIVLDEASMVSESIFKDLARYGVQILAVGDHGQLPPIEGRFSLMENPHIKLERIHRQAADNPIINLSMIVRENGKVPKSYQDNSHVSIVKQSHSIDYLKGVFKESQDPKKTLETALLCYKNATRSRMNRLIRSMIFGSYANIPLSNDIVICLRNSIQRKQPLYNGFRGYLKTGVDEWEDHFWESEIDFPYEKFETEVPNMLKYQFGHPKTFSSFSELENFGMKIKTWKQAGLLFDYGYAMTVHKCVHPDTLVETENGLQKISDINDNGNILTPIGSQLYKNKFKKEKEILIKITTKDNYSLTATKDHGIDVWNSSSEKYERIELSDVKIGDFVRLSLQPPICNKNIDLPKDVETDIRAKRYEIPKIMNDDFAEFLGLMVGDGCIYNKGFRFLKRHENVRDRFSTLCKNLFNIEVKEYFTLGGYVSEFNSTHLKKWLLSIDGLSPNKKDIPNIIIKSGNRIRAKFLKGLFEDGSVNIKKGKADHIEFSSSSKSIIDKVRVMLLGLGIVSTYYKDKKGHHRIFIYSSFCKVFKEKIGFISSFKNDRLSNLSESSRYRVPISKKDASLISDSSTRRNAKFAGHISRTRLNTEDELLSFHHTKIEKIEHTNEEYTYCITVPNGSRFIQNGFSAWNSQGTQMNNVILFNERPAPVSEENYRRWLYTAITRSSDKLVLML